MPRGAVAVQKASEDIAARKAAGGSGSGRLYFKVNDGEGQVVRFLEEREEFMSAWMHKIPPVGDKRGRWIVCRDQDPVTGERIGETCPGCEREIRRQFQGFINVIWRKAPVYARDEKGKLKRDKDNKPIVSDYADQIAVWQTGITVFEELMGKDLTYNGICSRDFKISRRGTGFDTKYDIDPADPDAGRVEMSDADKELAKEKYDLEPDVTAPSLENYWDEPNRSKGSETGGGAPPPQTTDSPFRRKAE